MNQVQKAAARFSAVIAITGFCGVPSAFADTYAVDAVHSSVIFKVKHMNMANFYGRFNDISGTINLDEKDAAKSSVEVAIKADSVDTGQAKRDEHVKGPEFFNTKQFPTITFKSAKVSKSGENKYSAEGELDFHGVKKPITAAIERTGTGKDRKGKDLIGGEARFTIKQSEFGIKPGGLSDDIELIVSIEAAKQ